MKRGATIGMTILLLVMAAGLARLSGRGGLTSLAAWAVEAQLGALVTVTETSQVPSEAPSGSPVPVPVETIEEAWDEEERQSMGQEEQPAQIAVAGDVPLSLRNATAYEIDFSALPAIPGDLALSDDAPVVLIVHTHGSECYAQAGEDLAQGVFRTQDPEKSVIAVGDAVAAALETRGYGVIHDQTLCDYPEYTGAYNRSRTVIAENLAAYPSVVLVLDIHRDAVEDSDGVQLRMGAELGGEAAAQVMLVVGSDEGGLENPDWWENLSLAAVVYSRMEAGAPGLMRPINLRTERFNQDLAPLNLLVEMGASGNTLEEACRSGNYLGQTLADVFDQWCGKSS